MKLNYEYLYPFHCYDNVAGFLFCGDNGQASQG